MTRLALIGCGRWGKNILRTLQEMPDVSVRVCEEGSETEIRVDGVLVATPSAIHATIALPFIERGIPTFIEKPMTTSIVDAERLSNASARSKGVVFVGHLHLFNPAFLALKREIPRIGAIHSLRYEGYNDRPRADSSVLWDWLPHALSMAHSVLGQECIARRCTSTAEEAQVQFNAGKISLDAHVGWHSQKSRHRFMLVGERGTLIFDDYAKKKVVLTIDGHTSYPAYEPTEPLQDELAAFVAVVSGTPVPQGVSVEDGLAVVRLIAEAEALGRR